MPYAHLALSHSCLSAFDVQQLNDFYLGAFMPDIRYFTSQPRTAYHFSLERVDTLARAEGASESFVLGYKTHLLLDQLWGKAEVKQQYRSAFPFFLQRHMSARLLEVALELFCLDCHPIQLRLIAEENGITRALGVPGDTLQQAVVLLQAYIDQRSLGAGLTLAQSSGMYPPNRLREMQRLARLIESQPLARRAVRWLANRASQHIYAQLVADVTAGLHPLS
jgi:hypothetical protein